MDVLYFFYMLSIALHFLSVVIAFIFCLPLQIREARVQDGLKMLRYQLLAFGIIIIALGIVSIAVLGIRFFLEGDAARYVTIVLVMAHAIGFLGFAVIGSLMYRQQYSEESKSLHKEIAKIKNAS